MWNNLKLWGECSLIVLWSTLVLVIVFFSGFGMMAAWNLYYAF